MLIVDHSWCCIAFLEIGSHVLVQYEGQYKTSVRSIIVPQFCETKRNFCWLSIGGSRRGGMLAMEKCVGVFESRNPETVVSAC